jgi:hypothetical protein
MRLLCNVFVLQVVSTSSMVNAKLVLMEYIRAFSSSVFVTLDFLQSEKFVLHVTRTPYIMELTVFVNPDITEVETSVVNVMHLALLAKDLDLVSAWLVLIFP